MGRCQAGEVPGWGGVLHGSQDCAAVVDNHQRRYHLLHFLPVAGAGVRRGAWHWLDAAAATRPGGAPCSEAVEVS